MLREVERRLGRSEQPLRVDQSRVSRQPRVARHCCLTVRGRRLLLLPFRIVQFIVQDVQKSAPPPLLPLLRSRLQAEVLTLVLLKSGQGVDANRTGLACAVLRVVSAA
jgi:hypothetical protein